MSITRVRENASKYRIAIIAGACCLAFLLLFVTHWRKDPSQIPSERAPHEYPFPDSPLDIKGFSYQGMRDGQTLISISARRFNVQKKKIGAFSVGLLNEVSFENATFRIYGKIKKDNQQDPGMLRFESDNPFASDIFNGFPVQGISGIQASPIILEFLAGDKRVSSLIAKNCRYDVNGKSILLTGKVQGVSGDRRISADNLRIPTDSFLLFGSIDVVTQGVETDRSSKMTCVDLFFQSPHTPGKDKNS